ncbi:MAG: hypoxanthine phosphoribosyltransferase [Oscillospiraceae bacterium]|nr:hypoxanthine phosphoribosyltransferase [Oscillospiraceae bacterium]
MEDNRKILISAEQIAGRIKETAAVIDEEYKDKKVLLVSVLKGAFIFLADFARALTIPCEIGFMAAQSYGDSTVSGGEVKITLDLSRDISDYDVILVEDIIDTGNTLYKLKEMLLARNPRSFRIITLLDKPSRRTSPIEADMTLFTIEDKFVIGYGLDYAEKYRNLPDIEYIET